LTTISHLPELLYFSLTLVLISEWE
jgi:hypothetical protein